MRQVRNACEKSQREAKESNAFHDNALRVIEKSKEFLKLEDEK